MMVSSDTDICNYEDDIAYYVHDTCATKFIGKLEKAIYNCVIWFNNNYMKLNTDKCHLMIFGKNEDELSLKSGSDIITERKEEKLFGVIINRKLSFTSQVSTLFKRPTRRCMSYLGSLVI